MLELKGFCQDLGRANPTFDISEATWEKIAEFHGPLKLVAQKVTHLQRADITLSDAFGDWYELLQNLRCQPQTQFVVKLISGLENRGHLILKNPLMLASVFLDPRYNLILTSEDRATATSVLSDLNEKFNPIERRESNDSPSDGSHSDDETQYNEFERFLRSLESRNQTIPQRTEIPFLSETESFRQLARQPIDKSIHIFWHEYQRKYPILFKLSNVIMSIPPTEVSCERNFSKLKFIMNRLRCNLKDDEIEKMMFLNLNSELFYLN